MSLASIGASIVKKRVLIGSIIVVIILVVIGRAFFSPRHNDKFRMSSVQRGDLLVTVSATGTVEPQEVIDVGAQVAGLILEFGKDTAGKPIDYGSIVEQGSMLARIDDSLYAAELASAAAQVKQAQADLLQSQAKLLQADQDWKRAQQLGPSNALSHSSYDNYKAAYEISKANTAVSEAAIAQAQALLTKAQRNITLCTIVAPVKGVVIDRRVNIGQTVVSSLNAPSLFLLAKDLTHMQVWVAVNEADIGNIHPGQKVSFSVDAFPGERFSGTVGKIRLNATMTQNVVTYTVEVETDNASGKLLPYLTANVQFEVSNRSNVLLVPNAALRWNPKAVDIAPEFRAPTTKENGTAPAEKTSQSTGHGRVWVKAGDFVRPVDVEIGATDTVSTEIKSGELQEGTEVVLGDAVVDTSQKSGAANNPFAPQVLRGRGK